MTVREALLRHLREGPRTAHELSGLVGIPEKQVADHLAHVARSLRRTAERLRVEPAQCLDSPGPCRCRPQHLSTGFVILLRKSTYRTGQQVERGGSSGIRTRV